MNDVVKKNPELYHYTKFDGLEKILRTQCLRLTYIRNLNDASEMIAFRPRLETFLNAVCLDAISKKIQIDNTVKDFVTKKGGAKKVAIKASAEITNMLYKQLIGTKDLAPFARPFIMSFCTPSNDLIAEHGLLSQWRAYGQDGGFALVFDTKKLHEQIQEDGSRLPQRYSGTLGDVVYSHESDEHVRAELSENIFDLENAVSNFILDGEQKHLERTIEGLVNCACLYKNWGFFEEREVRIVIVPFVGRLYKANENEFTIGTMPIVSIENAGQTKDYIFMLKSEDKPKRLPIKRIIVGPHANQRKHKDDVNKLLRQLGLHHIKVTKSKIPYI